MNNYEMNRYNADGSENLDYWFGPSKFQKEVSNDTIINRYARPRYVRYTMNALKKRSTERLEKMHHNLFGKIATRQMMIDNLYRKLNSLWDGYTGSKIEKVTDEFGFEYIPGLVIPGMTTPKETRGRKAKFEEMHIWHMIADYEYGDMNLTQVAEKWHTNIATVSNIINGKGTYSYLFEV